MLDAWAAGASGLEPAFEGATAFPGRTGGDQALRAGVLVKVRPGDAVTIADHFPVVALGRDAWTNRGYRARGTEMVRPSESSARCVFSVMRTCSAAGIWA